MTTPPDWSAARPRRAAACGSASRDVPTLSFQVRAGSRRGVPTGERS